MSKPVQDSLAILRAAKAEINKLLKAPEHQFSILEINRGIERVETRLTFMGAVTEPEHFATADKAADPFPPITNFMGKIVTKKDVVTVKDINPDKALLEATRAKVRMLYDSIRTTPTERILDSYNGADDAIILQGVAKWARVPDYESKAINSDFIEEIKVAIDKLEKEKSQQQKIDKAVLKPEPKILTQDDILADADIFNLGAEVGDELIIDKDGVKSIKKKKPVKAPQK